MKVKKKKVFSAWGGISKHDTDARSYKREKVNKFNHNKVNFLHGNKYRKHAQRSSGALGGNYLQFNSS